MGQPEQTLNQDPSNDGLGASSSPDSPHYDPERQNIVGTVEDYDDLDLDGEIDESSEETLKTDDSGQTKDGEDSEEVPFHKHPRWQEVLTEKEQLKSEITSIREEMKRLQEGTVQAKGQEKLPYIDITTMDPDKLRDWNIEDPKGYAANLYAQMRYELFNEVEQKTGKQKYQEKFQEDVKAYKEKHPDFETMLSNGEIGKFLNDHPAHNPISAHQLLTAEKKLNEAIKAAKKEEREETLKQLRAKKHSQVLGSGPVVSRGPAEETELTNTKQKGGLTSVLADRLQAMRRKAG
jgi:hypothetical protein